MNTTHRLMFIVTLLCISLLCLVVLVLFVAMWDFRELIGWLFISLVILLFVLLAGIIINEQYLRHRRVSYHSELPLDLSGKPLYIPQEMKQYQRGGNDD